jgi:3-oxoacyl-[acyl-carrier-protein] synthase II
LRGEFRQMINEYVMNNNFAFGGVNTSLIFRRWH